MSPLAAASKVQTQHQLPWDSVLVPFRENSSSSLCSPISVHPFIIKLRKVCEVTTMVHSLEQALCSPFPCHFVSLCHGGPLFDSLAEVQGGGHLLSGAPHAHGGSGSRLWAGAPPCPALPAGRGTEAPLPRVFDCGFQHPKPGLRILREGGLFDLYPALRSDLPADPVPRLAFRYGAFRGHVGRSAWKSSDPLKFRLALELQSLLLKLGGARNISPVS